MKILNLSTLKFTLWHVFAFFIVICYHNIYIFTEESVLLFCFVVWVNITWNYISPQVNDLLVNRAQKIHTNFQQVSIDNIKTWKSYRQGYSLRALHVEVLNKLISYLSSLIKTIVLLESQSKIFQSVTPFLKRLYIVKSLETKLARISYTIICQRIHDIAVIREFYVNQLKIKSFNSEAKLDTLERIRKLEGGS